MTRRYIREVELKSDGTKHFAIEIGIQNEPDEFQREMPDNINELWKTRKEGYWLIVRGIKVESCKAQERVYTDKGVDYGDFIDLCTPFDRKGRQLKVGDVIIVASKSEAREVEIQSIDKKISNQGYGIYSRKLKVKCLEDGTVFTVNNGHSTIRI